MRHVIDRTLNKLISRKLLAWATATTMLLFADLTSSDWTLLTIVYIGTQGAVDIAARLKGRD